MLFLIFKGGFRVRDRKPKGVGDNLRLLVLFVWFRVFALERGIVGLCCPKGLACSFVLLFRNCVRFGCVVFCFLFLWF